MKDLKVRRGATLNLEITDDEDAISVTLTVKESADATSIIIEETASFTDGIANITITDSDTLSLEEGEYVYQLLVEYENGTEIYPEAGSCEDDECELPAFIVCESLLGSVS